MRNKFISFLAFSLFSTTLAFAEPVVRVGGGRTGGGTGIVDSHGGALLPANRFMGEGGLVGFKGYVDNMIKFNEVMAPPNYATLFRSADPMVRRDYLSKVLSASAGGREGQIFPDIFHFPTLQNGEAVKKIFETSRLEFSGKQRLTFMDVAMNEKGDFVENKRVLGEGDSLIAKGAKIASELLVPVNEGPGNSGKRTEGEALTKKLSTTEAAVKNWVSKVTDAKGANTPLEAMAQMTQFGMDRMALERLLASKGMLDADFFNALEQLTQGLLRTSGSDALDIVMKAQVAVRKALVYAQTHESLAGAMRGELLDLAFHAGLAKNRPEAPGETGDANAAKAYQIAATFLNTDIKTVRDKCGSAKIGECNLFKIADPNTPLGRLGRQRGPLSRVENEKGEIKPWGEISQTEQYKILNKEGQALCLCAGNNPAACAVAFK